MHCCHQHPEPIDPAALLQVKGLGLSYGHEEWAIRGIDLEVHAGEIIALIGPNGAGKSSLLRAMAGLMPPNEGTIHFVQHPRVHLGYVPQQHPLDRSLPISVDEFLALKEPSSRHRQEQLRELGIAFLAPRKLGELSGGELQRVMIAYSLVDDPQILLLDEPLTGVDMKGGTDFQTLLLALQKERGLAVVLVSHDLHMVGAVANLVLCLNRHLCCSGTPAQVLQDHVLAGIYGAGIDSGPRLKASNGTT
jgi:zinc transport system ATP-binding protein